MRILIGVMCMVYAASAAPQFVTFKDGKIGVNFGGYHAEAGLGGLLTGDAAHGGLGASAGTPWGPQAAAGLGGQIDDRTAGVAYAGAQANPEIGASAVLGGNASGREGFIGSEAHSNGKVYSNMHTANQIAKSQPQVHAASPVTSAPTSEQTNYVQKIKPPKKYTLIKSEEPDVTTGTTKIVHSKKVVKSIDSPAYVPSPVAPVPATVDGQVHLQTKALPNVVFNALNIPIGILRSLQESLGGLASH